MSKHRLVESIKATLMQRLKTEGDKKSFVKIWNKIDKDLQDYNEKEDCGDANYDSLFAMYFYFLKPEDRKNLKIDHLHVELPKLRKYFKNKKRHEECPINIIKDLQKFSESYLKVLGGKDMYTYCLYYIQDYNWGYWWSILMVADYQGVPYYEELKKALLSYYYQNWMSRGSITFIKKSLLKILEDVKNKKPFSEIKKYIRKDLRNPKRIEEYESNIKSTDVVSQEWIKKVLVLLEYSYKIDKNGSDKVLGYYGRPGRPDYHLEHIYPQTPKKGEWDFTAKESRECIYSLGNLTLLKGGVNQGAGNKSFIEKKNDYYKDSDFELTKEVSQYKDWRPEDIEARTEKLIKKLDKIFKL